MSTEQTVEYFYKIANGANTYTYTYKDFAISKRELRTELTNPGTSTIDEATRIQVAAIGGIDWSDYLASQMDVKRLVADQSVKEDELIVLIEMDEKTFNQLATLGNWTIKDLEQTVVRLSNGYKADAQLIEITE